MRVNNRQAQQADYQKENSNIAKRRQISTKVNAIVQGIDLSGCKMASKEDIKDARDVVTTTGRIAGKNIFGGSVLEKALRENDWNLPFAIEDIREFNINFRKLRNVYPKRAEYTENGIILVDGFKIIIESNNLTVEESARAAKFLTEAVMSNRERLRQIAVERRFRKESTNGFESMSETTMWMEIIDELRSPSTPLAELDEAIGYDTYDYEEYTERRDSTMEGRDDMLRYREFYSDESMPRR